mgnify:CR=1 FL=1
MTGRCGMLNIIWAAMMLLSFVCAAINGRMTELTNAVFSGGENAVSLCIALLATVTLWSGMMNIAKSAGIVRLISKALRPFLRLVFNIPADSEAAGAICMNIAANMLGLSNAATPFGLEAMRLLSEQNQNSDTASDDMITFVLINTASVQIIPTTIAQLRVKYGSLSPMDIAPCIWITSITTLIFALCLNVFIRRITKCRR